MIIPNQKPILIIEMEFLRRDIHTSKKTCESVEHFKSLMSSTKKVSKLSLYERSVENFDRHVKDFILVRYNSK